MSRTSCVPRYRKLSKNGRGRILDEVVTTVGMGRSTSRRMLTGSVLPDPAEQVDRRRLRQKTCSDEAGALLEHVWALMGMAWGKYRTVMLPLWLPLLREAATSTSRARRRARSPSWCR